MSKTAKTVGVSGPELDALLDRNTTTRRAGKSLPVGFDLAALARLLG